MAAEQFVVGEYVDITIRNVKVVNTFKDTPLNASTRTVLVFKLPGEDAERDRSYTAPIYGGVVVERVGPAEWPPQPGDLWRGCEGDLWFAARYIPDYDDHQDSKGINGDGWRTVLVPLEVGEAGSPQRPEDVIQPDGPFTLVRRELEGGA